MHLYIRLMRVPIDDGIDLVIGKLAQQKSLERRRTRF